MTITDPHSGRSHTIHKDSGLYKDLLHKLHVAKVGDCIGDSDTEERPIRRNNSYTSYTMAIYGIQGDPKYKEVAMDSSGLQRRSRADSYSSYSSAMSNGSRVEDSNSVAQSEVVRDLAVEQDELEVDHPAVSSLFQFLQILTACFGSFAHGGNDVRYAFVLSQFSSMRECVNAHSVDLHRSVLDLTATPSVLLWRSGSCTRAALWSPMRPHPSGCSCMEEWASALGFGCGAEESSRRWART